MAEAYSWLFVDFIPLLYERQKVARQIQVETWLDLTQLLKELKLEMADGGTNEQNTNVQADYVV